MPFDPASYGPAVQAILALDGHGDRLMPLASGVCSSVSAREAIQSYDAAALFPAAQSPQGALSGLYLYFSCLDESHTVSQELHTADGSFWHGIMHRQEPDPGNSAYWFRRVGTHPIFTELHAAASAIAERHQQALGKRWDPLQFIDFCEEARQAPGTPRHQAALEIQRAEWQLLFDYCASEVGR